MTGKIKAPEGKCRVPGAKEEPRGDLEVAAKLKHFPVPGNIPGERKSNIFIRSWTCDHIANQDMD